MTPEQTPTAPDLVYSYKPSLLGAAWEFRLRPDALEWQAGRHAGTIPYDRIVRVRLSFRPVSMQTRRFVTEIWPATGGRLSIPSTSWRSLVEQTTQDQAYGAFVRALHRRMLAARTPARFESGVAHARYWPSVALFVLMVLAFAALIVRALQAGAHVAAGFGVLLFGLLLWQSGNYLRRNRPGRYRPDALPKELVP